MTYGVMYSLLCCYKWKVVTLLSFIGKNTLPIVLFSPLFTILAKTFLPFTICIDSSGCLFAVFAITFTIAGCLAIAWAMDTIGVTGFFVGRKNLYLKNKDKY